jgi:aryl-alcohol dehydrogenase-like predicted oxidoreductase
VERAHPLGSTGIRISPLTLGTMMFGPWGTAEAEECTAMIDVALAAGINAVDTADMYSGGESEIIVGKALAGRRDDVILGTKCFWPMGEDPNRRGLSRRWITRAVEDSLRRLGTDWIDIFYFHKPDPATDIEESLGAVADLIHAGKVRLLGTSSFPSEWVVEAAWAADRTGAVPPRVEQPAYSAIERSIEADVLPVCRRYGMGVQTFSPLAGGLLTGKYAADREPPAGSRAAWGTPTFDLTRPAVQRKYQVIEQLAALALEAGLELPAMALAFAQQHPAVSSVLIGPKTLRQLRQLLAWAETCLSSDVLDQIDAIVPPGTDVDPADRHYQAPGLDRAARRKVAL